jgi:hypothetical protein
MKKYLCLGAVLALVFGLSQIDGATSKLRVRSSPLGRKVHTHETHTGKVRSASCAGVSKSVGAARFGAVRAGACECGVGCLCGTSCNCGK